MDSSKHRIYVRNDCKHGVWKVECKRCKADYRLKHLYGIDSDDRDRLLVLQDSKCAICNSQISFNGRPSGMSRHSAVIDHCHSTGVVRGILCGKCNLMLGACDDLDRNLYAAIQYLQRHQNDG